MFDKLSIPVKGEPPRAAWGAGVANRLNELCAMAPARMLVRDGPTGTGFAPLPANHRDRRGGSAARQQLFTLRAFIEKNENGNSRLAVEWLCTHPAVGYKWNFIEVNVTLPDGTPVVGGLNQWIRVYSGDWVSDIDDLDENETVYLNCIVSIEINWQGDPIFTPLPDCSAVVSTEPIEDTYELLSNSLLLRTSYKIGRVKAVGQKIDCCQLLTGTVIFADFLPGSGGGGGGGGGGGTVDRSCFRIESQSIEGIGTVRYIVDNYYNVGGVTKVLPEVDLATVVVPGERVVVYLFLAPGGIAFIESCQLEQFSEIQNNPSNYAFPLYLLSSAGEILTDFRSAPQIQLVEMI